MRTGAKVALGLFAALLVLSEIVGIGYAVRDEPPADTPATKSTLLYTGCEKDCVMPPEYDANGQPKAMVQARSDAASGTITIDVPEHSGIGGGIRYAAMKIANAIAEAKEEGSRALTFFVRVPAPDSGPPVKWFRVRYERSTVQYLDLDEAGWSVGILDRADGRRFASLTAFQYTLDWCQARIARREPGALFCVMKWKP